MSVMSLPPFLVLLTGRAFQALQPSGCDDSPFVHSVNPERSEQFKQSEQVDFPFAAKHVACKTCVQADPP